MRRSFVLVLLALVAACSSGPIQWDDSVSAIAPVNDERPAGDSAGVMRPRFTNRCDSIGLAVGESSAHAAWWQLRADSSADVVTSSTSDGGRTWSTPVRLDTLDVARIGCARPTPGIATDGDNVQVAYSMKAKEGSGIFLAHSMDRGRTFHSPVAVVYGERPGLASVAATGNFVVVAFEDPNTTPTRISVAVSTTMAHLFDFRQAISSRDAAASHPIVTVSGKLVVLRWRRSGDNRSIAVKGTIR